VAGDATDNLLEQDQALFERVMEGLRAGPGTLQWDEALREIERLDGAAPGTDVRAQIETLTRVRRRLAAGRHWREISAGDAFTRKLLARLDESPERKTLPLTGWIVVFGMLAVAGTGVYLASQVMQPTGSSAVQGPVGVVGSPVVVWDFRAPWPARTRLLGSLATTSDATGWKPSPPAPAASPTNTTPATATAILDVPLAPDTPVAIEVTLELPASTSTPNPILTQFVITDSQAPDRTPDPATSLTPTPATGTATSAEWVCQIDPSDRLAIVAPGPEASSAMASVPPGSFSAGREITLRILLGGQAASVEVGGVTAWNGALGLSPQSPRYVGIRFLAKPSPITTAASSTPTIKQLRVLARR
jgi:hypothetical protein